MYVPRGRRSQTTPPAPNVPNSECATKVQVLDKESAVVIACPDSKTLPVQHSESTEEKPQKPVINKNTAKGQSQTTSEQLSQTSQKCQEEKPPPQKIVPIATMTDTNAKSECCKIESSLNTSDKDYNEEKELQRASKVHYQA